MRDFNASEDQLCVSMVSTDKPYFFYALTSEKGTSSKRQRNLNVKRLQCEHLHIEAFFTPT